MACCSCCRCCRCTSSDNTSRPRALCSSWLASCACAPSSRSPVYARARAHTHTHTHTHTHLARGLSVSLSLYIFIFIALDLSRSPFFLLNLRQTQTVSSAPGSAPAQASLIFFFFGSQAWVLAVHTCLLTLSRSLARSLSRSHTHAHAEHYDYGNTTVPKDLINTMQTDLGKSKSLTQSAHSVASSVSEYTYHIPPPVTRTHYETVDATANASHVVSSYAVPHHAGQLRVATMTVRPDSDRSLSDRVLYPPLPPVAKGASPSLLAQNWGDA